MRIRLLARAILATTTVRGQEAITSAGDIAQNDGYILSWGVGEVAIETFAQGDYILTQGFQQTKLEVVSITDFDEQGIGIVAYPNPTSDFVTLKFQEENLADYEYQVLNAEGRALVQDHFKNDATEVSFINREAGVYFIRILDGLKPIKTFKIVRK
jgi:hypothetical protein